MKFIPEIGKTYPQRGNQLHIIAMRDGIALIENQCDGKVTQYIVTDGLYIETDGDLHWRGNGKYFMTDNADGKDMCDTLNAAWQCFYGKEHVHILLADTDQGSWSCVYKTRELALAALQIELDNNSVIQHIAEGLGLSPLKADVYLRMQNGIDELSDDYYTITETRIIDEVKAQSSSRG